MQRTEGKHRQITRRNQKDNIWTKWKYQYRNRNYRKEPNRNFGAEQYNNWIEKFIRRVQYQVSEGRKKESVNLKIVHLK